MFRYMGVLALAGLFALGGPGKTTSTSGSWLVDARHSNAQLITDGTTDYGKTKINVALGPARVNGKFTLDNDDLAKSSVEFRLYPATSMAPAINEDGKFLSNWLADVANHTLVCFHSKEVTRRPDGKLQVTGNLVLTRVDRNIDATPSEAYAGPVYGPPMLHRVTREATFVFDVKPDGSGNGQLVASGSTKMAREDFPQLVRTVVSTYWPPVVQDEKCQAPAEVSEDYSGSQCTGTVLETPSLPAAPHASSGEDVGVGNDFNAIVGNRLSIVVQLRLTATSSTGSAAMAGN